MVFVTGKPRRASRLGSTASSVGSSATLAPVAMAYGSCESIGDRGTVSYARASDVIVLLLLGGDKRLQQADIERAKGYWRDYQERTKRKKGKRSG
jgi:hypothetical protein